MTYYYYEHTVVRPTVCKSGDLVVVVLAWHTACYCCCCYYHFAITTATAGSTVSKTANCTKYSYDIIRILIEISYISAYIRTYKE
jgi:hypothetical protein